MLAHERRSRLCLIEVGPRWPFSRWRLTQSGLRSGDSAGIEGLRSRLTNLFQIPVKDLWSVSVAEARRRLGMPEGGVAAELYRGITLHPRLAAALREEWRGFGRER